MITMGVPYFKLLNLAFDYGNIRTRGTTKDGFSGQFFEFLKLFCCAMTLL